MMKQIRQVGIALAIVSLANSVHASTLTVTSSDLQGWGPYDMRVNGSAGITDTYARNGNGSLQFTLTSSADKAGYAYQWNPTSTSNPFGVQTKLGNISAFSYDWLRDSSSTVAVHLQLAAKILTWTDTDNSGTLTVGDFTGFLIYEKVYNGGGNAPTNSWQSENVLGANLWQWSTGKGANENFDKNISEWLAGEGQGHPNSTPLNANTYIYGFELDGGSGWSGQFTGAVDNATIGFGGNEVTSNFEVVPEPSSAMLGVIGAIGILRRRRR